MMGSMTALDDLKDRFNKFRTKKYAIFVGLALTFAVCVLLLIYASNLLCFGLLLVALAGYYIPYLFGMRSKKKLAVWGIVLILLLALPYTVSVVEQVKGYDGRTLSTASGSMVNGTVTPFQGDESTVHQFSVLVTDPALSDVRVLVFDGWTSVQEVNASMSASSAPGGTLYTYDTTLNNRTVYIYGFIAFDGERYTSTSTSNYGPIHVTNGELYTHWLPVLTLYLFIQVGILYFLLLALSFWMERSKARVADARKKQGGNVVLPPAKSGKEEKFICSECGAEVPSSSDRCPQCGERFDDQEEAKPSPERKDEFVCTECGATVDENAKTCWKCGKEFEN
ncbi:MAG: zinc ribbon domain-containing protein [Methanomassiliicoccus sp.]|nr:zinc ribbon domain-containing protein [Methanomassiliicoccus sp.]